MTPPALDYFRQKNHASVFFMEYDLEEGGGGDECVASLLWNDVWSKKLRRE